MKISDAGLDLIKSHEGLRLTAYPDPATGGAPWTIGYGHTAGVKPGDSITEEQATDYLRADLAWVEDCIAEHVDATLTQGQFDALCSLIFNIGCGAFKGSTLCKLINEGNFDAARQQFGRWNKAAGREMAGLTARRKAEADMFA